jgi:aspartyl-tRNA(Asn)/glutamyl-tRNA(Gln) amidotransferase subunit C
MAAMVSLEAMRELAELSMLHLTDEELERLAGEMDSILTYIGQLERVSLDTAAPAVGSVYNVLREDGHTNQPGQYTEEILAVSPRRSGQYFSAKKILPQ